MKYDKPSLSIPEQITLLKKRGLIIKDDSFAADFLSRVSYYRFSAYLLPFQIKDGTHTFKQGATFDKAYETYVFDRELRGILFKAIERIEIALRSRMINIYSSSHDCFWYSCASLFHNPIRHADSLERINKEISKSSEIFIKHYKNKYNDPSLPPVWMAFEVASFGTISRIYKNLLNGVHKNEIADSFHLPGELLSSWLESLTFVRNVCAHHARVWNRKLTIRPQIPKRVADQWLSLPGYDPDRIYVILAVIRYLSRALSDGNHFVDEIKRVIAENPEIPLNPMGFPVGWGKDLFWK